MYIKKNKSVALVHKILRIKGNPQCCSFVFTFVFRGDFSRMNHLLFVHVSEAGLVFGLGQRRKLIHVFSQRVNYWFEPDDPGEPHERHLLQNYP